MGNRVRVVHIINSFEHGGAEAMLCNLLLRTDRERFEPHVVSLIDDLRTAGPVRDAGIPLHVVGLKPGIPDPVKFVGLWRHLRRLKPDVVQTWMDHSNLIGGLAARFVRGARVVWGIHHSNHLPGLTKGTTLLTVDACAKLSRGVPSKIICCSEHARNLYAARGFANGKLIVIPNGFNTDLFRPDPDAPASIRAELGIAPDTLLIGLVARYDPFKDHANFVHAAGLLHKEFPHVHFLLCGNKIDPENAELMAQIQSAGVESVCHLLGPRRDVPKIHASLDILASSSVSEAFPLTVGEAMACGTPCVATDVGDSALMIGDTGKIVPASNSPALAVGWAALLRMDASERVRLGTAARRRVRELFDLTSVTRRYEAVYHELAGTVSPADALESPEIVSAVSMN
ncbi:MAG TPA: glycosyltransferase [Tepidisphaeraceae bacterium]|nr:glycosyltransferase [Tepidisphaeraceae bacterium]